MYELENLKIASPAETKVTEKVVVGGWRMLKSEVFIPPKYRGVLSAFIGNGVHLLTLVSI